MDDTDIFHDLVMSEERSQSRGYKAGLTVGKMVGSEEGFKLGWEKGASLGSEVGFYLGFAEKMYENLKEDQSKLRVCKVLQVIIDMIEKLPRADPSNEVLFDQLGKIRAKFKQILTRKYYERI